MRTLVVCLTGWWLLGVCFAAPVCAVEARGAAAVVSQVAGYDWQLHPAAVPADDAGYLSWNHVWVTELARQRPVADDAVGYATIVMPSWAELAPRPGQYNWDPLDQAIRDATVAPGTGVLLAPMAFAPTYPFDDPQHAQRPVVPPWVIARTQLRRLSNGTLAFWNNAPAQALFAEFLHAFAARYADHPKVIGVAMLGLDPYHGEWCWRGSDAAMAEAEADHGLTPAALERWGRQFIDDYVAAFAGHVDRLAWPGSSRSDYWAPESSPAYRDVLQRLWRYAHQRGCGGRDGGVESANRYVDDGTGQRWTPDGNLEIIEDFAPIAERRLWYTENEIWRALDEAPARWHHLIREAWYASCLRTLQMRRRWMAVGPRWHARLEALDPPFMRWVEHQLGQTSAATTEIFCRLDQRYRPREGGGDGALVNIERWLVQRDHAPHAGSRPAQRYDLGPAAGHWTVARSHAFLAREPTSRWLTFDADDALPEAFARTGVCVLISWYDDDATRFRLRYWNGQERVVGPWLGGTQSGLQSVALAVPDLRLANALEHAADFMLERSGGRRARIAMVRVLAGPSD